MLLCACAYGVKSEISLDTGDSASNAVANRSVLSVFINQRCAEYVSLYYGLRVCGQKYFAQSYVKIWIQLFQQFIGVYSKSNMTTGHKKCQTRNIMLLKFTI